ncbi:MAG: transcriptional regulator [Halobacteriales archaeon]
MTGQNPDRTYREELLEEFGLAPFGETLVIEVASDDPVGDLRTSVDQAETGEEPGPARIELDSDRLRQLLTPRRIELVQTILETSPGSISELADLTDRSYPVVYDDVELLADVGIVVLQREGRGKRPVIPYDRIEYSGVIARADA